MTQTYLTTEELSERIKYTPRTIRVTLKDNVLIKECIIFVHLVVVKSYIYGNKLKKICVTHCWVPLMQWLYNKTGENKWLQLESATINLLLIFAF